jgi:hypothetical protein
LSVCLSFLCNYLEYIKSNLNLYYVTFIFGQFCSLGWTQVHIFTWMG